MCGNKWYILNQKSARIVQDMKRETRSKHSSDLYLIEELFWSWEAKSAFNKKLSNMGESFFSSSTTSLNWIYKATLKCVSVHNNNA